MNPNSQQHIAHQFDSYCKKVLKYYARDYYAANKQRNEQETTFSGLSESCQNWPLRTSISKTLFISAYSITTSA